MPSYDYGCHACHHSFEKVLRIDDRHMPVSEPCPSCGVADQMELLPAAPFIGDPMRQGRSMWDSRWTNKLQAIKDKHPNSNVNVVSPRRREI